LFFATGRAARAWPGHRPLAAGGLSALHPPVSAHV